jgi:aerobic-type carbon monoxide dehydrogenase small subunit (CoxS/CutS family)
LISREIALQVNGVMRRVVVDPRKPLLDVLREDLDLIGSKAACGEGACGACTVLVRDQPVRACITPVGIVNGSPVLTIEGLAENDRLHPLQRAFLENGALQCGFCTPGMIMSGVGLLRQSPDPSEEEVAGYLHGNVCRCGCYPRIVRAVRQAAAELRTERVSGGVR